LTIDDDLNGDLGPQRSKHYPINNDSGDICSQITDEDHRDLATQIRVMLEMLLKIKPRGKPNRGSNGRGCWPKRNEWLPKGITALRTAPHAPNEAPWAQD